MLLAESLIAMRSYILVGHDVGGLEYFSRSYLVLDNQEVQSQHAIHDSNYNKNSLYLYDI